MRFVYEVKAVSSRRGVKLDGILIVEKPEGITSHDVVYKVKKLLNEKVGHTGTLDPLATGVLPLLIRKRY